MAEDAQRKFMRMALRLARRGYGRTSPNPMVGAVVVHQGKVIGRGWHRRAGEPHAEIEALRDAARERPLPRGTELYVTLEPCCTHGRTPPCTEAILGAGIKSVVGGATDPNPRHRGRGFAVLRRAGVRVVNGVLEEECTALNEAFNHWITHRTPLVTVKAAMSLDGKIALASGESKWITGEQSRTYAMNLRLGADAILVGINTILADDPSLTIRVGTTRRRLRGTMEGKTLRRLVLDSRARTPAHAKVVTDEFAAWTTIVISRRAPKKRVARLSRLAKVMVAPLRNGKLDLKWVLARLGAEGVTSLLVEGGGEVNASFLLNGLAQRVAFFYAPKILGGRCSPKAVAGAGVRSLERALKLCEVEWKRLGEDLLLLGRCVEPG